MSFNPGDSAWIIDNADRPQATGQVRELYIAEVAWKDDRGQVCYTCHYTKPTTTAEGLCTYLYKETELFTTEAEAQLIKSMYEV